MQIHASYACGRILEVKEFLKEPAALFGLGALRCCWAGHADRAVDDLIQFTAIQPNAAAAWAVIDLDPAAVGDDKGRSVDWTFHSAGSI